MITERDENSIFRTEALQHKREGWFWPSRLHIPSSLSLSLITGFITSSFIVLIIVFGRYSKRVNVTGTVVFDPPAIFLVAQNDGIVTYSSAFEGAVIKNGKPIFSINSDIQTTLGSTKFKRMELLKSNVTRFLKKLIL